MADGFFGEKAGKWMTWASFLLADGRVVVGQGRGALSHSKFFSRFEADSVCQVFLGKKHF